MLTGPSPRLRDLGHLRPILRDGLLHAYHRWALAARDDFELQIGARRHVVVVRPESIRAVLGGDPAFARNTAPTKNLFGDGILRLDGAPWRARRELLAAAFRPPSLADLVPIIQDETDRLLAAWRRADAPLRPTRDLAFLTLRILGRAFFGFSFDEGAHGGRPLHRALVTLALDPVLRHLLPAPLIWVRNHRAVAEARRTLDGLAAAVLRDGDDTPFIAALRGALARGELDRPTIIDEIRTILIAGHETTATALAWTLALVAERPDVAASIRDEAAAAAACRTLDDVSALAATARVAREAMRLFPPVPISISRALVDTELGRLHLRRGARVDVCSYVIHRLPWLWPDPDHFDPQRFAAAPAPGTYLPFLLGPHTCLGLRVAMAELPLILARIVGAFDLHLPVGPPRLNLRLSLNPSGLLLRVRARPRTA